MICLIGWKIRGLLDVDNKFHILALQTVYVPVINEALEVFRKGWNSHKLSTDNNRAPKQIWLSGILQNINSEVTPIANLYQEDIPSKLENILKRYGLNPVDFLQQQDSNHQQELLNAAQIEELSSPLQPNEIEDGKSGETGEDDRFVEDQAKSVQQSLENYFRGEEVEFECEKFNGNRKDMSKIEVPFNININPYLDNNKTQNGFPFSMPSKDSKETMSNTKKAKRRLCALEKMELGINKKAKIMEVMKPAYMSSDEENGQDGFITHQPSWQSSKFKDYKSKLDNAYKNAKPSVNVENEKHEKRHVANVKDLITPTYREESAISENKQGVSKQNEEKLTENKIFNTHSTKYEEQETAQNLTCTSIIDKTINEAD
ncbi:unnamed protein product [Mytilus edulis]|uniref:Integrase core domain-containing protein n=1 Tax=Mytilus edulis TaxID=6550 RepID=A0A8S3RHM1_MYTED|nr:unnamed protein product [Mytilus edulis]